MNVSGEKEREKTPVCGDTGVFSLLFGKEVSGD